MQKRIPKLSPIFLLASQLSFGATFTVTNTEDSGPGSLRQAILDAKKSVDADRNTIEFKIPGPGPYIIRPGFSLPTITVPMTIDGTTHPGFSGQPIIELDGSRITTPTQGLY
ncbi:MAG: hypothetical protein HY735_14320, partial [Verrucomicrobia bacterium]|nr:hypothetical protein [Verrucomicrobiota bacterium]